MPPCVTREVLPDAKARFLMPPHLSSCVHTRANSSSPLAPQVSDSAPPRASPSAPRVPPNLTSPQSVSVSLRDPGICGCTKHPTHGSLPPASGLVYMRVLFLLVCYCPPPPKNYPGNQRRGGRGRRGRGGGSPRVRFSSPSASAPQRLWVPSISRNVDVEL